MANYNIGPGVRQAMVDNADEPRSDELYQLMGVGHKVSVTYGRDAVYFYYQEDNRVNRLPFER